MPQLAACSRVTGQPLRPDKAGVKGVFVLPAHPLDEAPQTAVPASVRGAGPDSAVQLSLSPPPPPPRTLSALI